jgi:hypothetical protein
MPPNFCTIIVLERRPHTVRNMNASAMELVQICPNMPKYVLGTGKACKALA